MGRVALEAIMGPAENGITILRRGQFKSAGSYGPSVGRKPPLSGLGVGPDNFKLQSANFKFAICILQFALAFAAGHSKPAALLHFRATSL